MIMSLIITNAHIVKIKNFGFRYYIKECENEIVENDNKTKKQKINKKIIINK